MSLRIGLDARTLLAARPTGVERVVWHLVDSLARVAPADQTWELFIDEPVNGRALPELPGELHVVEPRWNPLRPVLDGWLALQMRSESRRRGLDAFVSVNTKQPLMRGRCFTTVHGLEWRFRPKEYRYLERLKQWGWFQLSSRWSVGMITFANHTASDIRRLRPSGQVPVKVVPEGVAPCFRQLASGERDAGALVRLGVREPYVLSVCSLEPRKNIDGLLRAFASVAGGGVPHQLVLTGRAGWRSEGLDELVRELGLTERVVRTGYVSEEDLVQLYNHAELFAYPSKYEGFGLPVVEAMACGAPVLTSSVTATGEVAGTAAELVDPAAVPDIARGLERCLREPAWRAELSSRGLARARDFSWDEMARGIAAFVAEHAKVRT